MSLTHFFVLLTGFAAGFFDAVVGAGGLVSVPALVFTGLTPQVAIATDRLGVVGSAVGAFYKFNKAKKIVWKYVLALSAIALIGSLIGANLLIQVDVSILEKVVGILIIVLLPLVLLNKEIGVKAKETSKLKKIVGFFIYFLIMIFGGFFGQGTGPLIFYTLTYFLGLTLIEVLATGLIPWLVLSLSSLVVFANNGIVDYTNGVLLFFGMTMGSYVGAQLALSRGNLWIKRLFGFFVIISGIKLLFF
jgi:uncharacterized membrane protein YfcA